MKELVVLGGRLNGTYHKGEGDQSDLNDLLYERRGLKIDIRRNPEDEPVICPFSAWVLEGVSDREAEAMARYLYRQGGMARALKDAE